MKSICYIVPYFGKLPKNFNLWLNSCRKNPTINWLIYTDDYSKYNYPDNVKVIYCTFDEIKKKFQKNFEFKILIDRPWKLCDFRVAYGEVFKEDIKNYDFWGYCDMDVLWGDIREFITDDLLDKYIKIGFQGHSTLYRNCVEVNNIYKREFKDLPTYKEIFSKEKGYCFDENIICEIYDRLNIPYYKKTNFIHLRKYEYNFSLAHLPKEEEYKNENQIFLWDSGKLYRKYVYNKEVFTEEFMYIHFFCRPITYLAENYSNDAKYLIYPEVVVDYKDEIDLNYKFILKKSKKKRLRYFAKSIYMKRKKITFKKIIYNIKRLVINQLKLNR